MAAPTFQLAEAEKNASIGQFFYRQLFVTPTLPQNINLEGKTAIVSGANTGLGLETARQLLDLGLSRLIIAVRNESKGQTAKAALSSGRDLKNVALEVWALDMMSYESVTAFADRANTLEHLHIAVLNAGVMKQTHATSPSTGHEEMIQLNYLSTALLTIQLLPVLKAKAEAGEPSHLVWVTSELSFWANFKEQDSTLLLPEFDKPENFNMMDRYSTSKLLGQLFATELTKRVPASVAVITMPTPGWCYDTGLGSIPGWHFSQMVVNGIKRVLGRQVAVGARTVIDGAVRDADAHGQLLQECKIVPQAPFTYKDKAAKVTRLLWDETMAELSFARVEDIVRDLAEST